MKDELVIEIRVDEKGHVNFSIEKDGVKRSAGFGGGTSHHKCGNGASGCMGISDAVRNLAREARMHLYAGAAWLDIDAHEGKRND